MAKNILLTTLSTKPKTLSLNYYYTPSENGPCFCSGISQLEAGSKYILSTIPIHKLVVVGSNETIDPAKATDITKSPESLTATMPLATDIPSAKTKSTFELYDKLSAYDLYKKRMTAFLSKTSALDEEAALGNISKNGSIDPNRVAQLKELTNHLLKTYFSNKPDLYPLSQKEVMTTTDLQKSLQKLLQKETDPIDCLFDIVGKLKKAVQENVNNSFLASHDTEEYDTLIKKHAWNAKLLETEQQELLQSYKTFKRNYFIFTSLRNANKNPNNLSFFEEQKKAIEQDTSLSSLARQYLYIQLKDYMDIMQKELMQRDILEIKNEVYQLRLEALQLQTDKENLQIEAIDAAKEIAQLKLENKRLQFELQLIKSNRINYETAYVRYYLFSLIQDTNKLQILPENTQIPLIFVPEVIEQELPHDDKATPPETQDEQSKKNIVTQDNLSGLVDALYEKGETEQINLYIDMQGGSRTSGYVRNAVLSILTNQPTNPVTIKQIVATRFDPNKNDFSEIVDETARYKIIDLASGMNAFIRYGKADIMESYCDSIDVPEHTPLRKLVNNMIQIDNALSLCDINELTISIECLQNFFQEDDVALKSSTPSTVDYDKFENIYQVLKDGIRMDYGVLLEITKSSSKPSTSLNMLELIDWACRKGFIQQALTLIESKMSEEYFDQNWLTIDYPNTPEKTKYKKYFMKTLGKSYETEHNRFFYLLAGHIKPDSLNETYLIYSKNNRNGNNFKRQSKTIKEAKNKVKALQFAKLWLVYQNTEIKSNPETIDKNPLIQTISSTTNNTEFSKLLQEIQANDKNSLYAKILDYKDFNDYLTQQLYEIKEQLHTLHTKLFSLEKEISKSEVTQKSHTLYEKEILTLQKRFLFLYCKFCTMQKYLENRKDHEYSSMAERMKDFTLEQFYYFIAIQPEDTFFQKEPSISFTILSCLNAKNYLISSREYVNELKNFKFQLHSTLDTIPTKEKLEEVFLLHQALKIERNCNNHASQKGIRLPKSVVERAIKLYVEKFREIQEIMDKAN